MVILSFITVVTFAFSTAFCVSTWREIRKLPTQSSKKRRVKIASVSIFSLGMALGWIVLSLELTPWLRSAVGLHAELEVMLRSCFLGLGILFAAFVLALFSEPSRARRLCIWGSLLALPYFLFALLATGFELVDLQR
jgi:hypothetical protein